MKAGKSGHRVYVGNIPGSMSKQDIIKTFEEYGKITEIDIKYNRNTNGTNYAFIEYENYRSAEKTIEKKNGQKLKGYMLKVEYSIDKKNKEGGDLLGAGREGISKGFMTNLRLPKNRSHYRVVDEITIAEYDSREGMVRAVKTLDRTLYNARRKVYVRVIKDLPYDDSDVDDSIA
ncbi:alternative splicing factor ASF-1 [Plasmodium cynomolgi strain B]|uniref:Alternative splicing factor ASF-1 n=1 Tax=Plasmodium cynomolgi (strain B) TaxID=1120755 RepID=K6UK26_PLACD|nr:alternative splicing factor ASF-1 [Plasmodium cynomolgi strain B]GAB66473.1 alternative splicing factor ASF-1 [Plasmodium cynomolgi strain B]